MEGTWGRRIFGRITRMDDRTKFILTMNLSDGKLVTKTRFVRNVDLERYPYLYKYVLNTLTMQLEHEIKNT